MSEAAAGLYLHVPFCARVCPYCDFAVRTGDRDRRRRYVDHLLAEIELAADDSLSFDTVYFGGGTPSSLLPEDLTRILDAVRVHLRIADAAWLFLEVNPEDVTRESAAAWRRLGIDTISLGVQSMDPAGLKFLGRQHDVDDVRRAVASAHDAGFRTVSVDLIYGRPGQTDDAWSDELTRVLELEPHHISCYQLTIHERTRFGLLAKRGRLVQSPADTQADLFRTTHRRLNAAGMQGYEVSQFAASPAHRSRHNVKYWEHTPYLGLGPAAHSYRDGKRWWNLRRTDPWQEEIRAGRRPIESSETLDAPAVVLEALMTGLRTYEGVDLDRLRARWGIDLQEANAKLLERLQSEGLASLRGRRVIPTLDGLAVADGIASSFVIDAAV